MPPPGMEGDAGRLRRGQRAAWQADRRHTGSCGKNCRSGGSAAFFEDRFVQESGKNRPWRRCQCARQPAAFARLPGRDPRRTKGCAAARGRRNRQHRHAHRRAPGQSRRTVEHGPARLCGARHGNRIHVKRPLEGITVVGLEQVIAGPFCTRQLAELGARVIKIERPGAGDAARDIDRTVLGQSSHFVWANRSKESLALDVKHADAAQILDVLLAKADVFVQNLAPGAADRLGLGAAQLRARYPRLIWCGISGYGPAGPYAQKRAYDLLVQCEAGLLSVTGTEADPSQAGIAIADIASGMYAMSSILAALLRREHTGEGATLDITMFGSLAEWVGFPGYFTAYGGSAPPRSGAHHPTIAPYGPFNAAGGATVFLSLLNETE